MLSEYDFSNARSNPYAEKLKRQITINVDIDTISFFEAQAESFGIPYTALINQYLSDCAENKRQLRVG